MRTLALAFAVALVAMPAMAQQKIGGPVGRVLDNAGVKPIGGGQPQGSSEGTGVPAGAGDPKAQEQLWEKIASLTKDDLTYAKALADGAATAGSKIRSQCYEAILTANQQASGTNLKNPDGTPMQAPGEPSVFTKLERAAEIIDNLQPTSPLLSNCAAAAQAVRLGTLQFVTAVVGGLGAKALTGGVIPIP